MYEYEKSTKDRNLYAITSISTTYLTKINFELKILYMR